MNTEEQPLSLSNIQEAIPDKLAEVKPNYTVSYGIRLDDNAMVFHFYPPQDKDWDKSYKMTERLEAAIEQSFDTNYVKAVFTEELNSFCIIVFGLGGSADPWPLVAKFLKRIDEVSV